MRGPSLLWPGLALSYLAASISGHRDIALAVVGMTVGAVLAACGWRAAGLATGLVLAGAGLYWSNSLLFAAYVPPLAGFAFMAFFFQRTLRPGSEPLISRVARIEHPDLPTDIARYTRTLTWVWSGCFLLLLATALLLAAFLPLSAWSRWVQGLGIVIPVVLFLGEYVFRRHRLREHRHASLPALIRNIIIVIRAAARPSAPDTATAPTDMLRH